MSPRAAKFYEFDGYRVDMSEKRLLHGDETVPITPKVFDTLRILVENAGHLVERDVLLETLWPDRFVEEGNVTFNIKTLRKALGDNADEPRYIETVPRRGYRFISPVRPGTAHESRLPNPTQSARRRLVAIAVACVAIMITATAVGSRYLRSGGRGAPLLATPFSAVKLSTNGQVMSAAMSPDGSKVVYTIGPGHNESVWLRDLRSDENVEFIEQSNFDYRDLAFSSDGNSIYFSRRPDKTDELSSVYRTSIPSGVPVKLIDSMMGWISVSTDDALIAFSRCPHLEDEYCSIWIADGNGADERRLLSKPRPFRIAAGAFSPDGKSLAFAYGQSQNAADDFRISILDLEARTERDLTSAHFFDVKNLKWLPDGKSFLITASRLGPANFQIWQVSATDDTATALTNDSESYGALSMDSSAERLVSTRVVGDFRLVTMRPDNPSERRVLADAERVAFATDETIFFQSERTGNREIWSMRRDGTRQRQLTNNVAYDARPLASADGRSVFFSSNRSGETQIWRMNTDGSDQKQITTKNGGLPVFATSEWIYYHHALDRTLWRASLQGGVEELVLDKSQGSVPYAFSADGSRVAFLDGDSIAVVKVEDRKLMSSYPFAVPQARITDIAWFPDGNALAYVLFDLNLKNHVVWRQPIDGGGPSKIADLGSGETHSLSFAPDGQTFAFTQGTWKYDAVLISGLN
jgi:Tol biopolymer transport system component/DNA-binding winged helix-turn-helix (wHTH) protein